MFARFNRAVEVEGGICTFSQGRNEWNTLADAEELATIAPDTIDIDLGEDQTAPEDMPLPSVGERSSQHMQCVELSVRSRQPTVKPEIKPKVEVLDRVHQPLPQLPEVDWSLVSFCVVFPHPSNEEQLVARFPLGLGVRHSVLECAWPGCPRCSSPPAAEPIDYAASKAWINTFSQALAAQLAPAGIRVNAVAPALTFTPFLLSQGMTNEVMHEIATASPMGRLEQPVELASLYVGLAENAASYVSAALWSASGGQV